MANYATIVEATGFDLRDPLSVAEQLVPALGARWQNVLGTATQATALIGEAIAAVNSFNVGGGAMDGLAAIKLGAAVFGAVKDWLAADAAAASAKNVDRLNTAREQFIDENLDVGSWIQQFTVTGPTKPQVKKPTKWSDKELRNQYRPLGIMWSRDRGVAKKNVLAPTWPYFDLLVTPEDFEHGFPAIRGLLATRGAIPAVSDGKSFWCAREGENTCENVLSEVPSFLEIMGSKMCLPVDTSTGCALPPGLTYTFSWGTFPFMGDSGQVWAQSPSGAAYCASLLLPTPIHALVDELEVRGALDYFAGASGYFAHRVFDPQGGQVAIADIYLDPRDLRLYPLGSIQIGPNQSVPANGWNDDELVAGDAFARVHVEVANKIMDNFEQFYRTRYNLLAAIEHELRTGKRVVSPATLAAAKQSRDTMLKKVARGESPAPYIPGFRARDPLRLGPGAPSHKGGGGKVFDKDGKSAPGRPARPWLDPDVSVARAPDDGGGGGGSGGEDGGLGGLLLAGGLAGVAGYALRKRLRRGRR